jgi:hypothetical protein
MPRDCILLKSGTRKGDLPYVAKVTALWENPEDGKSSIKLLTTLKLEKICEYDTN